MEDKIIRTGQPVVERFLRGVSIMDELVGGTLGLYGRNRIIERKYRSPLTTNDGVTVARHVILDDEMEDLAAQTLVEAAMKTNDRVGDGTTTTVVVAAALFKAARKRLDENAGLSDFGGKSESPMMISRMLKAELPKALSILEGMKRDLEGEELDNVVATSLENLEFGKTLGELIRKVGKDGYISTEENWGTKYGIDTELTTGMRFYGTYASPYLMTRENQKEAEWEDTLILVTNEKIETPTVLAELIKEMQVKKKRKLVIIDGFSENQSPYSREFLAGVSQVMKSVLKGNLDLIQILAVKAPSLTSEELQDVASFTDARFIDKNAGMKLLDARMVHLGYANKVVVGEDDVNIVGGKGDPSIRIATLKEQADIEKDAMFKEKTLRRIASLSAGVGIIRVGAATEQERTYLKYKIEDAVAAAKAALEEGIVPGGGKAMKKVAEELGPEHILYEGLMAPYRRIQENAGFEFEIDDEVIDPYKVVRIALTNAISCASELVPCDGAIANRKLTVLDYFEKKLGKLNPAEDDFRDAKNQDLGRGRLVD